ncbi:hypothetical protein D3C78_1490840 [compost metagenome]
MHHHLQRIAQGSLVSQQQADDAEVGELARFGHAQAKALATAGSGRVLQQPHGRIDRNAVFGHLQAVFVQTDGGQQIVWVEPQVVGHLQIVGQDGGTNELGHSVVFPSVVFMEISRSTISQRVMK